MAARGAMKRLLVVLACAAMIAAPREPGRAQGPTEDRVALQALEEEIAIAGILDRLRTPILDVAILRNVTVVDPVDRRRAEGQSIVVADGRIAWVGDLGAEPHVAGATVIDGQGRYAAPGLTDMHIHSESASSWLLNLANGVTTIREMDGFPWMLAAREAVNNDRLLGPTSYVAGTIINFDPLGGYAVTPRDAVNARRVVRQQAACGYDFIKIHNVVPLSIFDAVAEQAAREGMDLVGHVPQEIPVRYAIEHGMRTMEHLKGFLNDRNLQIGDTDYDAADNPAVWVTPTLSAYLADEPRDQYPALLHAPEARYVPMRVRLDWEQVLHAPEDAGTRLHRDARLRMRQIIRALVPAHAHFLAGTDAANYPFQVMGFVLFRELRMLGEAGVPADELLRAATSSPAAAMRAEHDFGRIRPGMRADIVLLDRDPLGDPLAYEHNSGVMARGRWLSREAIDGALAELAALYARNAVPRIATAAEADLLARRARNAAGRGFVFNPRVIAEAAAALRHAGRDAAADRLAALAVAPTSGACAAIVR
jgi:imidazolonepropionase-like amidohydrolase